MSIYNYLKKDYEQRVVRKAVGLICDGCFNFVLSCDMCGEEFDDCEEFFCIKQQHICVNCFDKLKE